MIIKTFELQKLQKNKSNIILLYGENDGFKNQVINDYFLSNFKGDVIKYEENEVLNNIDQFLIDLMNKSFFVEKKIIIISRVSEKIMNIIDELISKKLDDIIIINSGLLEKKSKLRNLFEKDSNLTCIPFYSDDNKTLNFIANNFFKEKKILISQETINLLVERCRGDRKNLNNELLKIENFSKNNNKVSQEEIIKITNLAENYSVSELTDNCLSKNLKKTISILNENNYTSEDCILILRTLLLKSKRLLKLKESLRENKNIDQVISSFKPPIFWKDKEIVKKQVENWTENNTKDLIYQINDVEILVKKNSSNSLNFVKDFILNQCKIINN